MKAGAGYVIGNYLLKGITVLSTPIFTKLMSKPIMGEYTTYMGYEGITYVIVGIALHSSINSARLKYKEKLEEYISSIIVLMLFSAAIWLGLVNAFYPYYGQMFGYSQVVANILVIHSLSSSLWQVYNVYVSLSYRYQAYLKACSFNAIMNLSISVILVLTLFSGDRSLGRIVGTVIPLAVLSVYFVIYFFKKAKPKVNWGYWRYGIGYSLPIVPHGISQVVLSSFDNIMINKMEGKAEAGLYGFAFQIYSLYKVFSQSLENLWKTWMFEQMESKSYDNIRKAGTDYAFGMGIFSIMVFFGTPEIVRILGRDPEYWEAAPCVIPIVAGGFFAFLYMLPANVEYFYDKTKAIAIGTFCAALCNIGLNWIFIQKFGYVAAAYTTLVTYFLYFIFHYVMAWIIHGKCIFNTMKLMQISLGVLAGAALALFLEKQWYIRWPIEIVLVVFTFLWAEKKFGITNVIKKKLGKK